MTHRLRVSLLVVGVDETFEIRTNTSASIHSFRLVNPRTFAQELGRNVKGAHEVTDL